MSVSRLYSIDDKMINGGVGGMRTGKGKKLGENIPQCHFFHHKTNMT
jgi:hypothetical protein